MIKDTKSLTTQGQRFLALLPDTESELNRRSKIEVRKMLKKLLSVHPDSPAVVWSKSRLHLPQDAEKLKSVMEHFIHFFQAVEPLCEEKNDSFQPVQLFRALFHSAYGERTIQRKIKEILDDQAD